jgi:hypothetical protein
MQISQHASIKLACLNNASMFGFITLEGLVIPPPKLHNRRSPPPLISTLTTPYLHPWRIIPKVFTLPVVTDSYRNNYKKCAN